MEHLATLNMKESLKLLGIASSGLEIPSATTITLKLTDEELILESSKFTDLEEKKDFLNKVLNTNLAGYIKSKQCLARLIKQADPKYACDLIFSASKHVPTEPGNYLVFAEIAMEHKAWFVAKSALEVAKWLCIEKDKEVLTKVQEALSLVEDKIKKKEFDNSYSDFWCNKAIAKYWVLERLYFKSSLKSFVDYSFKLLNTFPEDKENYDVVCRIFSLAGDKESIRKVIEYINVHLTENKTAYSLYLAVCYYNLLDYDTSLNYLEEVLREDKRNTKALLYLALNYLMQNKLKEFVLTYNKIIPMVEVSYIAIHFISSAISGNNLGKEEFPNQKVVSKEVSAIIEKLLNINQSETAYFIISQFRKLNYYLMLPYLKLYLAELFIKRNELDSAKELLKDCNDSEVHRLYSWIYRLQGNDDIAEYELVEYRKGWLPEKESGIHCQAIGLHLPQDVPQMIDDILKVVKDAYNETKRLISQFDLEYALNAMTCVETGCQDCCTKTYPYVSYTEYLYLKDWLENNDPAVYTQVKQNSIKIVNLYKEKYKKDPPFLTEKTLNSKKEYPSEFVFNCPCLGDNKCNVYEGRPFTCRTYSYATSEGTNYKGCNYFYEQLKGASKLSDLRKVVDMRSFFGFTTKADEKLIGKGVKAPIPVWFSQSHDEILEKIKNTTD